MKSKNKKAQIWIETVIYTLIGLSIIGVVLGVIKPAIEERRDSISISQSIDALNAIESKIDEVKYVAGNSRPIPTKIGRGELIINGVEDKLEIIIDDSRYGYSEPGETVIFGNIKILTLEKGKKYSVSLTLDYKDKIDITYNGEDKEQALQPAPVPYNLGVRNNGLKGSLINIDFFQ